MVGSSNILPCLPIASNMNRRNAFKNIVLVSGTLITLPLWMQSCGITEGDTHLSTFSLDEQRLLASVVDTIIPAGNRIGALYVGVDKYLQKLIDDCYETPMQDNVKKQLQALNASAKQNFEKSFSECTQQQRQDILLKLSDSQDKLQKAFFDLMKTETIHGFNTSQKVMEGYFDYKVAPGHYYGCINVKA
jgi:Gluconate 2-dehydrogenase subunit 3